MTGYKNYTYEGKYFISQNRPTLNLTGNSEPVC